MPKRINIKDVSSCQDTESLYISVSEECGTTHNDNEQREFNAPAFLFKLDLPLEDSQLC